MNHQLFMHFEDSVDTAQKKKEDEAQHTVEDEGDSSMDLVDEHMDGDSDAVKKRKKDVSVQCEKEEEEDSKNHDVDNADPDVVVIDDDDDVKEDAEVKRRKLRKMVARSGGYPSFSLLLSANYGNSDDETPEDNFVPIPAMLSQTQQQGRRTRRKPIYVDVDEELGLKPKKQRRELVEASKPTPVQSQSLSAAEEGWYEGSIDVSLPEDEEYLSELHQWIRQQLEFFSATQQDTMLLQAGRRTPTVQGKVGLRCKHCATVIPPPTGSISYPHNLAGIYSACTQKPQLHFEQHCFNLTSAERKRLTVLLAENFRNRAPLRQRSSLVEGKSVPTSLYYQVAAKCLGLAEVEDGLRFGRDLTLEPLPFETIRLKLESETTMASPNKGTLTLEPVVSVSSEPRVTADEESEQVLAEALMEKDDATKLSRRSDKDQITDYWFLTIRQMAICHAVPADFVGKGKKTNSIGLAGFCCRHCLETDVMPSGGCRSFSSAADNLSSSISNSFSTHLQKCHKVPVRIKQALLSYKRLHQRQLAQLPYGSQRRLIHDLWARLRAVDISEDEMNERIKHFLPPRVPSVTVAAAIAADASTTNDRSVETRPVSRLSLLNIPQGRPESFPECKDTETLAVLRNETENWDPAENDSLLLPDERWLISDYLFLVMRQLKVAYATSGTSGSSSGRRPSVSPSVGICCMHCIKKDQIVSPSGRSFPSAPDNFASSMNNSLYAHMQACAYVPLPVKHALVNARKIHSLQCSSLKFGSQRRFFNLLHERLMGMKPLVDVKEEGPQNDVGDEIQDSCTAMSIQEPQASCTSVLEAQASCSSYGFLDISSGTSPLFVCSSCRMVPPQFRSSGSYFTSAPTMEQMRDHSSICTCDSFNLETVADLLNLFLLEHEAVDVFTSKSFARLIRVCVAGVLELEQVFLQDVQQIIAVKSTNKRELHSPIVFARPRGLWSKFPESVSKTEALESFRIFASEHELSPELQDHPTLLKYLLLIAPGLILH